MDIDAYWTTSTCQDLEECVGAARHPNDCTGLDLCCVPDAAGSDSRGRHVAAQGCILSQFCQPQGAVDLG